MTPEMKQKTQVDKNLSLMFDSADINFPKEYADRAMALYEKWEAQDWGEAPQVKEESVEIKAESDGESDAEMSNVPEQEGSGRKRKRSRKDSKGDSTANGSIRVPPANHPIWGVNGIMHGVAVKKGLKKSNVLDRRYKQRDAKVFGSNKLEVGDWFPRQLVALFRGAHGSRGGGISGSPAVGAYFIVVCGLYENLDEDHGEYLYYSGSNSHDNTDPNRPSDSSSGTLTLHTSLANGKPVRVLRTAAGKSKYRPFYGLRYDGLYTVVSVRHEKNEKGGLFEQFKLVRLEVQRPINRFRPNPQEQRDFEKIGEGFREA